MINSAFFSFLVKRAMTACCWRFSFTSGLTTTLGPRFRGVRASSSPCLRCRLQVPRCEEYRPSRRTKAPIEPESWAASAWSRIERLYSAVKRRRTGRATTSESGTRGRMAGGTAPAALAPSPLRSEAANAAEELLVLLVLIKVRFLSPPYSNCRGSTCLTDVGTEGTAFRIRYCCYRGHYDRPDKHIPPFSPCSWINRLKRALGYSHWRRLGRSSKRYDRASR